MNYSKFTDEILGKKLTSAIKEVEEFRYQLDDKPELPYITFDELSRSEREEYCTKLTILAKQYKTETKLKTEKEAKDLKDREDAEAEKAREIKRLKEESERARMILDDKAKFDRLKYRFFNLAVPSFDELESTLPCHSPPFFENKTDQFANEILESPYRLFKGVYENPDIESLEQFMQINRSRGVALIIESDFKDFIFACLRVYIDDGVTKYTSLWVSNLREDLEPLFDGFTFTEVNSLNKQDVLNFATQFSKDGMSEFDVISEIYTR